MSELKMKDLGEYTDNYMKADVTLLADVFEDFRKLTMRERQLDPARYLTAPSLANDMLYHMTGKRIENITDIDMLLMFEKAKRGGICTIGSDRYCKANHKYLKNYNPKDL